MKPVLFFLYICLSVPYLIGEDTLQRDIRIYTTTTDESIVADDFYDVPLASDFPLLLLPKEEPPVLPVAAAAGPTLNLAEGVNLGPLMEITGLYSPDYQQIQAQVDFPAFPDILLALALDDKIIQGEGEIVGTNFTLALTGSEQYWEGQFKSHWPLLNKHITNNLWVNQKGQWEASGAWNNQGLYIESKGKVFPLAQAWVLPKPWSLEISSLITRDLVLNPMGFIALSPVYLAGPVIKGGILLSPIPFDNTPYRGFGGTFHWYLPHIDWEVQVVKTAPKPFYWNTMMVYRIPRKSLSLKAKSRYHEASPHAEELYYALGLETNMIEIELGMINHQSIQIQLSIQRSW